MERAQHYPSACEPQISYSRIFYTIILPAQEGEDVLAGEFEQIQCVRPVEETQPPPQDPRQRQVGLDIEKKISILLAQ